MSTSKCDNCGKIWEEEQLDDIKNLEDRVDPDGIYIPTGQCPECGTLCYLWEDGKGYNLKIQVRGQSKADLLAALELIQAKMQAGLNYDWATTPDFKFSIRGTGADGPSDA